MTYLEHIPFVHIAKNDFYLLSILAGINWEPYRRAWAEKAIERHICRLEQITKLSIVDDDYLVDLQELLAAYLEILNLFRANSLSYGK